MVCTGFWRLSGRAAALALLLTLGLAACGSRTAPSALVLVSLDGFRWDYRQAAETPILDRLAAEGVEAGGLIPVFPSKTFPSHYSLVTGLYPEHHGIVSNNMYDPEFDAYFSLGNRAAVEDGRWWGGEPIWVTAVKQGKRSATLFWPGSEAEIAGHRPNYWKPFTSGMPYRERIDQVLQWLDLPVSERPDFVSLYFSLVDSAGHDHGPNSPELRRAVRQIDATLGRLVRGLEERGLLDSINLLVTSDHGMAEASRERLIVLDDYLDLKRVEVVDWSPVAALIPEPDYLETALANLKAAHPHLKAYRKEEMPEHLHYRNHRRIPPLLALADEGWGIVSRRQFERDGSFALGVHGYDNQVRSMHGIFLARGPGFRRGLQVEPFLTIHVFPLMAHLLGLKAPPNDGELAAVQHLLR